MRVRENMFTKLNLTLLPLCLFLFTGLVLAQSAGASPSTGTSQEARVFVSEPPLTRDEVMSRVRSAYTSHIDYDSIAADIDRRGIDFEVDNQFATQVRFMRATIVTNALWRADDRRKALMAKPQNAQ